MKTRFCRGRCNGRLEMNSEKKKKNMLRKCYHSITPEQCEEDLLIHLSEKSGRQKRRTKDQL